MGLGFGSIKSLDYGSSHFPTFEVLGLEDLNTLNFHIIQIFIQLPIMQAISKLETYKCYRKELLLPLKTFVHQASSVSSLSWKFLGKFCVKTFGKGEIFQKEISQNMFPLRS